MRTKVDAAERFPDDVKEHVLKVIQDEGVHRHLRFAKPGTRNKSFGIVTWPGHLCFYGDMGSYVFTRLEDMFEFFRHDRPNYGYWAEKCIAQDRSGIRKYEPDTFVERARELLNERVAELDKVTRRAVVEAFTENVLSRSDDEHDARRALDDFDEHGVSFSDTWEYSFEEFTYCFVWCCHALVYAIKQYDAGRAETREAVGF